MDKRNNDFDFDFRPLGLAIKKAREAKGVTREQLANIIFRSSSLTDGFSALVIVAPLCGLPLLL